jgi:2-iminobutanoate/2-iminopropanoate deaminase
VELITSVKTDRAPVPKAPYSQGVISAAGRYLFVSGQTPVDPATGQRVTGDFDLVARRVLDNLSAVVEAAGGSLQNAVKVNVYLRDMADFTVFNEIYAQYFTGVLPARTTIRADLTGFSVEVDAVVALA